MKAVAMKVIGKIKKDSNAFAEVAQGQTEKRFRLGVSVFRGGIRFCVFDGRTQI